MLQRGEYADILRAIGRSLDTAGASSFEIRHSDGFMDLSWQDDGGTSTARTYQKIEVERLRDEARTMRSESHPQPIGRRADQLRTLGQELDEQGVLATRILEDSAGLHVAGTRDGEHFSQSYTTATLAQASETRRAQRQAAAAALSGPSTRPSWWKRLLGMS